MYALCVVREKKIMVVAHIEDRSQRPTRADDGMVTSWPEPVRRTMVTREVLTTGIEMLKADVGLRIVPVNEDKSPIESLCPTWSTDATDDPQTLRQWHAVWPDVRWGIVPGERFLVADHDRGELDIRALGIEGTWAETTRRGTHYWCRIAPGLAPSGKTYLSGKRGEITTGNAGYVVASRADPYMPIDVDAPFVTLTETSPVLDLLRPQRTFVPIEIPNVTEYHHREARRIIARLGGRLIRLGGTCGHYLPAMCRLTRAQAKPTFDSPCAPVAGRSTRQ